MLAGTDAVQMVTTLYKKETRKPVILKEISNWMQEGYKSTADFGVSCQAP